MEVMTEEYCRQCPLFIEGIGYLEEDHPYWKEHPEAGCACKDCFKRKDCEANGSERDITVCALASRGVEVSE